MYSVCCVSSAYWLALALNLVIQAVVLFIVVMRTNWEQQVQLVGHGAFNHVPLGRFIISKQLLKYFNNATIDIILTCGDATEYLVSGADSSGNGRRG